MAHNRKSLTDPSVAKFALCFVLIIGIVNFFADMTYEGGAGLLSQGGPVSRAPI